MLLFSDWELETGMLLGGLCRSRGLKRKKKRIEKKDGGDIEPIHIGPLAWFWTGKVGTVTEAEAEVNKLGLWEILGMGTAVSRPKEQTMV